ncbi:MAG: pirin family protein [Oligoflexia bacterium]|nr:pirin family protein [Oligoflexia bacterium]
MKIVRPGQARGHADHGWLKTYHTFSFADYYDPEQMGFGPLRVINEDFVAPGKGFGMHSHNDMEIVTIILQGALQHRDDMGNSSIINAGEVQRMTAGKGVMHSEMNPSSTTSAHLLQIWIQPQTRGLAPSYEQKPFLPMPGEKSRLLVSPDGRDGSLRINQRANISRLSLAAGQSFAADLSSQAWVQVVSGNLRCAEFTLQSGDGLAVEGEKHLQLEAGSDSSAILFDLGR